MVSWRGIYLILGKLLDFASTGDGEAEVPVDETCSLLWNLDRRFNAIVSQLWF